MATKVISETLLAPVVYQPEDPTPTATKGLEEAVEDPTPTATKGLEEAVEDPTPTATKGLGKAVEDPPATKGIEKAVEDPKGKRIWRLTRPTYKGIELFEGADMGPFGKRDSNHWRNPKSVHPCKGPPMTEEQHRALLKGQFPEHTPPVIYPIMVTFGAKSES
ncbi:hypothetical protein OROGR_022986 [Orobanche gracilis]